MTSNTSDSDAAAARIAVAMQKGGVGKTTLTVHIGGALAQRGHDVLLVDLDPQGALTAALGYRDVYETAADTTMYDVLVDGDADEMHDIILTEHDEFDVAASHNGMVNAVKELAGAHGQYQRLNNALDTVETEYDYILVDCPPSLDVLTDNALLATQNIVIPAYAEELSVNALDNLVEQITSLEEYYDADVTRAALVGNRVEHNNESEEIMELFRDLFSDQTAVFEVRSRVALQRAISESNASIFSHHEETDMEGVFKDIAAHLDDLFKNQPTADTGGETV